MRLLALVVVSCAAATAQTPDPLARLKCGDLSPAEQRTYEDRLGADPDNPNTRSCLLVQAQLQKDWSNVARHTEWVIDNFANLPEAPGIIRSAGSLRTVEPALYAGIERKLREAIQQKPSVSLVAAAASLIAEHDLPLAIALMESSYTAGLNNAALSFLLGQIYARDVLSGGKNSRAILRESRDPYLLRSAAQSLKTVVDHQALVTELQQHAAEMLPIRPMNFEPTPVPAASAATNRVKYVAPEYPSEAIEAGLEGKVTFEIIIGRQGEVRPVRLISGAAVFVKPARAALEQWEYSPTRLNGDPIEVTTTVEVVFSLSKHLAPRVRAIE